MPFSPDFISGGVRRTVGSFLISISSSSEIDITSCLILILSIFYQNGSVSNENLCISQNVLVVQIFFSQNIFLVLRLSID